MSTLLPPVTVLGAGAFGTALAVQLSHNQPVILWGRNEKHMNGLHATRVNQRYLPGIYLPSNINCTHQLETALQSTRNILVALPSHAFFDVFQEIKSFFTQETQLLVATKGLYAETSQLLSAWLDEFDIPYALLSGPSFAKEIAQGLPASLVIASRYPSISDRWRRSFREAGRYISCSEDVIGISLCGAMKNVISIAVGMADGLKLGQNACALVMTQGFLEMQQLGHRLGINPLTLMSAAGIGDLTLTCMSNQSRNRRLGVLIGEGSTPSQGYEKLGLLSEGSANAHAICQLSQRYNVALPLCKMVYTVLLEKLHPQQAIFHLINHI